MRAVLDDLAVSEDDDAVERGDLLAARRREVGVRAVLDDLAVSEDDDAVERGDR